MARSPTPEWAMRNEPADMVIAPHVAIFPGLAIFLAVLISICSAMDFECVRYPKIDQE